ncbi:MAG TPA: T9SS type A sorting domain-containing protein, partial [Candidatus Cloacimonadota bacterium]|nr:T9SS type A sorting domain-containing protein [Candidatus Cloacimonadota bacterium]
SLTVYPNPVPGSTARLTAKLSIDSELKPEELSFRLYDLRGRRLATLSRSTSGLREGEYSIDLGKQVQGLYLLVAYRGDQRLAVTKLLVY